MNSDRDLAQRMADVRLSKRRVAKIVDAIVALATDGAWTLEDAYEVAYDAATEPEVREPPTGCKRCHKPLGDSPFLRLCCECGVRRRNYYRDWKRRDRRAAA